ncbi:PAS domain-containing sensor histidine kinase [Ramlibacter sp.]|uniref:PAS domain-containing sensor histidine kinase n=1 Tax=Ramlibacter sp. TaxID=1917967 RepID=UPI0017EBCBAE|nr:PAS domain-containing sensor histidine kinase [Ramlibacter sp.]MBA2675604.1 PAS domain-containing sensor histidine kinase [Ramlibacter sp.]
MNSSATPNLADALGETHIAELLSAWLRSNRDYAVILLDPQGRVVAWLGAAEQVLGFGAAEMLGATLTRIFTPEDRQRGLDRYELEVAQANGRAADERWHVRKDGTRIWASGTVTALRPAGGEPTGYVKILRDRTDVRGHIDTIENHVQALQSGKDSTRQFLRTLGHELRNPLAPLANAMHVLSRSCTDERSRTMLQVIDRQVGVLRRLADDLMDVTRLELGKFELHKRHVDLRQVLGEAATSLQSQAAAGQLSLQAVLPDAPLMVDADPDRLQQVVLNLLSNAIKYTLEGGTIWVTATQDDGHLMFRVQDTGIGIAPEMLPRIFDLFTQDLQAEKLVPGGLGVGLSMVRQIVELHGGTVQALSAGRGKGAEFIVRLPRRQPA